MIQFAACPNYDTTDVISAAIVDPPGADLMATSHNMILSTTQIGSLVEKCLHDCLISKLHKLSFQRR